ncbi:hypothetical protein EII29_01300 [Leptotrichia sp. OH3620_COT-345]|uniref:hypothetical protein n=1 Tax=Leptotrichia sp. OH3620_COT-345 TaxID=2491048 RepID=UPI000F65449A|nr:hypothetical protein [Leptotrichia sp. OH3620_COT-345]RRD40607.1 hypothetical protein EII29_01300 [Leptotrichia sp. OH3620_COT-345]
MSEITQFIIAAISIFIFYQYYSKISENVPLFFSFILINIIKMTKVNFVTDYISRILYYNIFIICLINIILCFKGKVNLIRVLLIGIAFITVTYLIAY